MTSSWTLNNWRSRVFLWAKFRFKAKFIFRKFQIRDKMSFQYRKIFNILLKNKRWFRKHGWNDVPLYTKSILYPNFTTEEQIHWYITDSIVTTTWTNTSKSFKKNNWRCTDKAQCCHSHTLMRLNVLQRLVPHCTDAIASLPLALALSIW